ncbi:MAG: hypothetical protein AAF211_22530 [Myxococcota bacterium]
MALLFALTACKVVDAPENLEELAVYTLVNLDERQAVIDDAANGLVGLFEGDDGQIEQGYRVAALTTEDLTAMSIDKTLEEGVIGAVGQVSMGSSLDDVADVVTLADLSSVFSRTEAYQTTLLDDSDRACFLSRECDSLSQTGQRQNDQPLIGKTIQEFEQLFRWAKAEDGRDILLFRTLVPEETEMLADIPIAALRQNYVLAAIWSEGGQTQRVEVNWVDAEILGLDLPDSLLLDQVVNAMEKQAEEIDAFVSGE